MGKRYEITRATMDAVGILYLAMDRVAEWKDPPSWACLYHKRIATLILAHTIDSLTRTVSLTAVFFSYDEGGEL